MTERNLRGYNVPEGGLESLPGVQNDKTPGVISSGTVGFSGEGNFGLGIPGVTSGPAIAGQDAEGTPTNQSSEELEARAQEELDPSFRLRARENIEKIPAQKSDLETFGAVVKKHEDEEGFHQLSVDGMGDQDRYK